MSRREYSATVYWAEPLPRVRGAADFAVAGRGRVVSTDRCKELLPDAQSANQRTIAMPRILLPNIRVVSADLALNANLPRGLGQPKKAGQPYQKRGLPARRPALTRGAGARAGGVCFLPRAVTAADIRPT